MKKEKGHKAASILAIILLTGVAANALAAGYSFLTDPSGAGLGISKDFLKPSAPVTDYRIPGLILFTVPGIGSLGVALLIAFRRFYYAQFAMFHGIILMCWIAIQLTMVVSFHPLHAIIAMAGFRVLLSGFILQRRVND